MVQTRTRTVACFLTPDFELAELASVLQVLTHVGRNWNWRAFRVQLVTATPGAQGPRNPTVSRSLTSAEPEDPEARSIPSLRSNCQVHVSPIIGLQQVSTCDVLVLPGGYHCRDAAQDPGTVAQLGRLAQQASTILSCSRGHLLTAALGLLRTARVACSPELVAELKQAEPSLTPSSLPVESHGKVVTCAAAASSAEGALRVVATELGVKIAQQTATQLGLAEPILLKPSTRLDPLG